MTYDCKAGYSLKGSRVLTCGINGRWSASVPTCLRGICGSSKLVGPSGSISSPDHPNSYGNNAYCRWKIVVATNKKASLNVQSLKTVGTGDRLELYDGVSGKLLSLLYGSLPNPIHFTSSSNEMDVKFLTDSVNVADGFNAQYEGTGMCT